MTRDIARDGIRRITISLENGEWRAVAIDPARSLMIEGETGYGTPEIAFHHLMDYLHKRRPGQETESGS